MKTDVKSVEQTFSFNAPAARSVILAGDFTHWQKNPIAMRKGADGIWRTRVALTPGEHHYRFLVDGEWHDDSECTIRVPESAEASRFAPACSDA